MDKIRNQYIRGTAQVGRFREKTREANMRWFVHVSLGPCPGQRLNRVTYSMLWILCHILVG